MLTIGTRSAQSLPLRALMTPRNSLATSLFRSQRRRYAGGICSRVLSGRVTPPSSWPSKLPTALLFSSVVGSAFTYSSAVLEAASNEKTPLEKFNEKISTEGDFSIEDIRALNYEETKQALEYMEENDLKIVYAIALVADRRRYLLENQVEKVLVEHDIQKLNEIIENNPDPAGTHVIKQFVDKVFFERGYWDPKIAERLILLGGSPKDAIHTINIRSVGEYHSYLHEVFVDYRKNSSAEQIQVLLQTGSNPNAACAGGTTPLHLAIDCYFDVVHFLHCDPNLKVEEVRKQLLRCIDELISFGADLNQPDWNGLTPFMSLIKKASDDDLSLASYLLERGADINYQIDGSDMLNKYGFNVLSMICNRFNAHHRTVKKIKFLFENGANPNKGSSPILNAVYAKDESLLALLLELGADYSRAVEQLISIGNQEDPDGIIPYSEMVSPHLKWLNEKKPLIVKGAK